MTNSTIPGTYNFRDLGGLPATGGTTRPGRLLRSDALTGLADDGFEALLELGVRTAVDLREPKERRHDPPTLADGTVIHHQPIFANAFELNDHAGLPEIYAGMLEHCGDRIAGVIRLLAEPDALPAVIFCSAGKDRTGLVSALTLSALGVPDDLVAEEYARTEDVMHGEFRDILVDRSRRAGYNVQSMAVKLGSPASLMVETLTGLRERHGDAAGYLVDHGLDRGALEHLREQFVS
jgi:protein-tyrosine phosphatase